MKACLHSLHFHLLLLILKNCWFLKAKKFKEIFLNEYCSTIDRKCMEQEFLQFRQENLLLRVSIYKQVKICGASSSNRNKKMDCFIAGLRNEIRRFVLAGLPETFQKPVNIAKVVEKDMAPTYQCSFQLKRKEQSVHQNWNKKPRNHPRECWGKTGACFRCGKQGHLKRDSPQGNKAQNRNQTQPEIKKNTREGDKGKAKACAFQMMEKEVEETPNVVIDLLPYQMISTCTSYMSLPFAQNSNADCKELKPSFEAELADGRLVKINKICRDCTIEIYGHQMAIDLILMTLVDWLRNHSAKIDCEQKKIKIRTPEGKTIIVIRDNQKRLTLLSSIRTHRCIRKGWPTFLAYVISERKSEMIEVKDVPVVQYYLDVFREDLPGLPPDRQVQFGIDLALGIVPIAKTPYRLAPSEMQELKRQLQEILDIGFI
ncbi:LOW QUALITY PROTEIN: hypothetical protein OSB04_011871 [Centaurea solstitialis]|uniref:CCHC-type domain-containing protein n=1 Tax=Centaurea solstitialis TaxID=347529 RepID=A0AA38WDD9_9ASTR|nr:LOW QUALITY PROTEIN: hypothetical protein OSB04_011871 [Centaurea solstitialis]